MHNHATVEKKKENFHWKENHSDHSDKAYLGTAEGDF